MPRPSSTLRLGDRCPDFQLRDAITGATRDLGTLLQDRRALLLVFHRGMWCPNCRGQLGELEEAWPACERQGIAVAVVLAQRCRKIAEAVARRRTGYSFPILCDRERDVIKRYGVWHPIGLSSFNTAHPACFLIEAGSRCVRYSFVGSTQFARAPMAAILDAAGDRA
ncbi:MAG TPA: redoxin domain-containing protein [Gemmatimonadaceae bacterium]|nr:redoxin domain-containing protein [Gemmatimonadaceae bacterium]